MTTIFSEHPSFQTPNDAIEQRVSELLAKLSLEEKIDLLGGHPEHGGTKPNERAGIPMFKMADGPVGVHWWRDKSTAYPALICAASSFDRELLRRMGWGLGRDARACGVHILLAPGVNIYRSPLCGRNFEYLGEDPYLSGELAAAYIRGVQSMGVAATVKHYAVNYQEFDRNNVSSDVDERTLHEVYLAAFRAAVEKGGTGAVMTGYNLVNGVHCSEHDELNNRVLKGMWGFDGIVMSDWVSTYSAVGAANGGLDLEMPFALWLNREKLLPALSEGLVSGATIDDKVRRLLRLAASFGWLDREQKDEAIPMPDPETEAVALDVARGGMVLLKNEGAVLPIELSSERSIAVLGSHADLDVMCGGGSSFTPPTRTVSVLEGIKKLAGSAHVEHCRGFSPEREWSVFPVSEYVTEDGTPGIVAEFFENTDFSGEPMLVRTEQRVDFHVGGQPMVAGMRREDVCARFKGYIVPKESGRYTLFISAPGMTYRLTLDGKTYFDSIGGAAISSKERVEVELQAGQRYALELACVRRSMWSTFHFGWELSALAEKELETALEIARRSDVVVLCMGFTDKTEGEGFDRSFKLPKGADEFIVKVAEANPRTVLLVAAGGNVDMSAWIDRVAGLLYVWYPGQEGGLAAAEILFGEVNPSAKLPATFERRLEDRSSFACYADDDNDKRVELTDGIFGGYRHFDGHGIEPRFPFGFGLSYTTFAYANLELSRSTFRDGETVVASFDLENTGSRAGAEVAQLYVRDAKSRLPRPLKELKGFAKVKLEPGERTRVSIELDRSAFTYYDPDCHAFVFEPGEFEIMVGSSATDIELHARCTAE